MSARDTLVDVEGLAVAVHGADLAAIPTIDRPDGDRPHGDLPVRHRDPAWMRARLRSGQ